MNWKDHEETLFPSFEEGKPRRSSETQRYLKLGAAGEVKPLLQQRSDLPRCALFKVARHLLKGRSVPSSKEGNRPSSTFFHSFTRSKRRVRARDRPSSGPSGHLLPVGEGLNAPAVTDRRYRQA